MTRLGRLALPLIVVVSMLVMISPARAAESCHTINAKGEGRITEPTPTGFKTESRIIGGGLLHGTTTADLNLTSLDPTTGIATFDGSLVLTARNNRGTVTMSVADGVYNTVTGEFSSENDILAGTGRLEGASGHLFFHGFVLADGISFIDDEISGELCVDLAP